MNVMRAELPYFRVHKGGMIINVSSAAAVSAFR